MNFDYSIHAAELLVILSVAWKVLRVANRIIDVMGDFPPHKHINGKIVYPKHYEPTIVEEMK